jgi:hypothetical protein
MSFGGLRDIGEWAESRGNKERGVEMLRGGEDGGDERRRGIDVMTREGGHAVPGVCSPFEKAGWVDIRILCRLSKVSRASKVCRAQTLK